MKSIIAICAAALLSGCTGTPKPASDLSGAGFILESPNAATRDFIIKNDRPFAETVAVNRAACMRAPLCKK